MQLRIIYIFFSLFFFNYSILLGQNTVSKTQSELDKAHDKKFTTHELSKTQDELFQYTIYNIEKAQINKTHHWFLQLVSLENEPLNFATITLEGYLKSDPSVKFKYGNAVFPLCTEGKYIIGFVKVQQAGTWVLQAHINNFGIEDQITHEIEIAKRSSHF